MKCFGVSTGLFLSIALRSIPSFGQALEWRPRITENLVQNVLRAKVANSSVLAKSLYSVEGSDAAPINERFWTWTFDLQKRISRKRRPVSVQAVSALIDMQAQGAARVSQFEVYVRSTKDRWFRKSIDKYRAVTEDGKFHKRPKIDALQLFNVWDAEDSSQRMSLDRALQLVPHVVFWAGCLKPVRFSSVHLWNLDDARDDGKDLKSGTLGAYDWLFPINVCGFKFARVYDGGRVELLK